MRLLFGSFTRPLAPSLGDRVEAEQVVGARLSATTAQKLAAAAIVPMVAVTLWFALNGEHLTRPVAAGLYWSYLIAASMLIGLYWWRRRPASGFGPLLVVLGVLTWVVSWQGSNTALVFDVGVLAEAPFFLWTLLLFLAFPTGRLEHRLAHWLMAALGFAALAFFYPWALLSPVIAGGGPLTACAPNCPANALQVGSAPGVAEVLGKAETYAALALTAAVTLFYVARVRAASKPQRRTLMAVAVTSLLFPPAWFALNFAAWILTADPATLDTLAWLVVGARILLPLGFLIALLQAELFAVRALQGLLQRLAARPTPEGWRDMIAEVVDDRALRLAYRDPATGRFREAGGEELLPPPADERRAWVPVEHDGRPVAAMEIDETLAEDPELVRAAASATVMAVENGALEGELRASRTRILEAGQAERRRIERDLHDSAQQRLLALRVHLMLAGEQLDRTKERETLERLGAEVEQAIDELRDVAHGSHRELLARAGLRAALEDVAARSAVPVSIRGDALARHSVALETTVYFCCLECLQNAAKHAGPGASTVIRLSDGDGHLRFSVEDDGAGFDPAVVARGAGLDNLAERVAALGGTLRIDSRPGHGTRVAGEIPA
jgi:signal transduction histidine kinase